jgi:hypothetical protein
MSDVEALAETGCGHSGLVTLTRAMLHGPRTSTANVTLPTR